MNTFCPAPRPWRRRVECSTDRRKKNWTRWDAQYASEIKPAMDAVRSHLAAQCARLAFNGCTNIRFVPGMEATDGFSMSVVGDLPAKGK